jgi:hypothetical protein
MAAKSITAALSGSRPETLAFLLSMEKAAGWAV